MKYLLIAICLFLVLPGQAQKAATIKGRQFNIAYLGIDNPLTVEAEGYAARSLSLTLTNGAIRKVGDGHFVYLPFKAGDCVFTVYAEKDGEKTRIDSITWQVLPIPQPVPIVSTFPNLSVVRKDAFSSQAGVRALPAPELRHQAIFQVTKFEMMIISNDTLFFYGNAMGNLFSKTMKEALQVMAAGSRVIISNIYAIGPDGRQTKLIPLEYEIE